MHSCMHSFTENNFIKKKNLFPCLDSGQGGNGTEHSHYRVNLTGPLDAFHLMRHHEQDIHTSSSNLKYNGNKSPLPNQGAAEDGSRPPQR